MQFDEHSSDCCLLDEMVMMTTVMMHQCVLDAICQLNESLCHFGHYGRCFRRSVSSLPVYQCSKCLYDCRIEGESMHIIPTAYSSNHRIY